MEINEIYDSLLKEIEINDLKNNKRKIQNKSDKWIINQLTKVLENKIANFDNENDKINFINKILINEEKFSDQELSSSLNNRYQNIANDLSLNSLFVDNISANINSEFSTTKEALMITPFLSSYGVSKLRNYLESNPNLIIKIITTTYDGNARYLSLDTLLKLKKDYQERIQVKIENLYYQSSERLHVKAYAFLRNNGFSSLYLGSSNFTKTGMITGKEYNLKISEFREKEIFDKFMEDYNLLWTNPNMIELEEGSERIAELRALQAVLESEINDEYFIAKKEMNENSINNIKRSFNNQTIKLFDYQKEAVDTLFKREAQGKTKHLLVMATGTGKTITIGYYLSKLKEKNDNLKILFIAHQKEILDQAAEQFERVFKSNDVCLDDAIKFYDGNANLEDFKNGENIFASIQTLKNYKDVLKEMSFDVVIFDEAHHVEANTFKELFEILEQNSQSLIGLTATPERTDGVDVSKFFGHEYAYEVRLYNAIEKELLSSFDYFYIKDESIDLNGVSLNKDKDLLSQRLSEDARNEFVYETILKNVGIRNKETSCVLFCASAEQATKLSDFLKNNKEKAEVLISEGLTTERRQEIIEDFRKKRINYLCVRDMFNEGIDVPNIDRIFFLRPTNSLIIYLQQLGRGLRKYPDKRLQIFDFVNNIDMEKNKKYDPLLLIKAFRNEKGYSPKDLFVEGFNITTFIPKNCELFFEPKTEELIKEQLKKFESSIKFTDILEDYWNNRVNSYLEYKNMFFNNYFVPEFEPFKFYRVHAASFLKNNLDKTAILANFASMNLKWVLEEWKNIIEIKSLDWNKISHKLFIVNFCDKKYLSQNTKFSQDLKYFWNFVSTQKDLLDEVNYLINYKLDFDHLFINKNEKETISSFLHGNFTYNQIAVLFGKTIENNAFKSNGRTGGFFKIANGQKIISAAEDNTNNQYKHFNFYNPKDNILIWESPEDWRYNSPEKIDLNKEVWNVFYKYKEDKYNLKARDNVIREYIGQVDSILEKSELKKINKEGQEISKIQYKLRLK